MCYLRREGMGDDVKAVNPRIVCTDGVSLSVQAGVFLYSTPREDTGPYIELEVGFIRAAGQNPNNGKVFTPPDTWRAYTADGDEFPTDVYGYIPIELVEEFIEEHGGIKTGKLP